jgi:YbbR domain-containing protein
MRDAYLILSLIVAAVLWNYVTESDTAKSCSDYLLLGRTYDECITDKKVFK